MSSTSIDYINTYFQFKELTKIHGAPTYESLQEIKDQLKANAASVTSNLGGGVNGHLGLVLSPVEYTNVSSIEYQHPPHPGKLAIPSTAKSNAATRLTAKHAEALREFREVIDVKQALIKQIVKAVDMTYIKSLRDVDTNTIKKEVHEIMAHLFRRYGKVTPEKLQKEEMQVKAYVYNLQEPLVVLFDKVEDLTKLAQAAKMPYTKAQIINMGIQLIRNTHDFQDGLKTWINKSANEKTWQTFKAHFEEEHDTLREIRGMSMMHAGFHQANYVADRVLGEVESVQQNVIQLLQKYEDSNTTSTQSSQSVPPSLQNTTFSDITEDKAFAATPSTNAPSTDLMAILKQMQEEIKALKGTTNNPTKRNRRNFSKYCWTHGACSHSSAQCRMKKEGHKDEATKENKMGGSERFCNARSAE